MLTPELLPKFIQEPYLEIVHIEPEDEKSITKISWLYQQMLAWLGKLAFAAYRQSNFNSPSLNQKLFAYNTPTPRQWLEWLRLLFAEVPGTWIHPLGDLKDHYPSLKKIEVDDHLTNLVWFSELAQYSPYAIGIFDIIDAREQVLELVELCFSQDTLPVANTQKNNQEPCWCDKDKVISLKPWCVWCGNVLAWSNNDNSLILGFQQYLAQEFTKYQGMIKGEQDDSAIIAEHYTGYLLPPWLELTLIQTIQTALSAVQELCLPNIVLIEGHPRTGKTALAVHLQNILSPQFADIVLTYFIPAMNDTSPQTPIIQHWVEHKLSQIFPQLTMQQMRCKIVIVIDGIEQLNDSDWETLQAWLRQMPMRRWLFILLQRRYERHQITAFKTIILQPEDNFRFAQSFHRTYLISLAKQYLNSALSWRIFTTLMQSDRAWSVFDLAYDFQIFTPRILKKIQLMLPLLEVQTNEFAIPQYRLYHPILHGIPAPNNR